MSVSSTGSISTPAMILLVFAIIITILTVILLVSVRVRNRDHNDHLVRPSQFSIFPRSKASLEHDLTVFISPSRPTVVGRTSTKGYPVIHMTITPPTPAQLPSGRTLLDEVYKSPR
ncbi:hypothetical protein K503DRAFT_868758 [Rhizopogon vinicolor AM-OR11-026]|uniref:Uncharacterized protein n=1 Tax=Rhizopogon vinicolor AM-OR11-026 TaxID=1314800 RepID=A0A1B7MQ10_9AGAM|nr:hypothetical protein K503DRAFT_868758 [Rhizopogon vinicolor AM-OR11-026]